LHIEALAELVRFAPDVYGFRYDNHVSLFIVSDGGVLLVDPCGEQNPRTPALIKEAVRSVTGQPVRYVVYSHSALDHSMGGAVFADTASFVSTERAAGRLSALHEPSTPLPDRTFTERLSLPLGEKQVELYASGLSTADDYLLLHYPAGRLVMWVDIVQPRSLPLRVHGSAEVAIERIDWLVDSLDFDVLVTGHATPQMTGTKGDLIEQRHYYLDLMSAIEKARGAGYADRSHEMTAEVRRRLVPCYGDWRRFEGCLASNITELLDWREGKSVAAH
jgi:glyoxylase-like metal-dependent hydrolase (beta-lactamase superfamily II)